MKTPEEQQRWKELWLKYRSDTITPEEEHELFTPKTYSRGTEDGKLVIRRGCDIK